MGGYQHQRDFVILVNYERRYNFRAQAGFPFNVAVVPIYGLDQAIGLSHNNQPVTAYQR